MAASPPAEYVSFESAAAHARGEVPRATPEQSAGSLRDALTGRRFESASHVVVCEGERFLGILPIEDLLAAPADARVGELMDREPPVVTPGVDQEIAAWRAVRHRKSALCVVDTEGRFVGLIPPHRLLAVLLSEHEEDLSRLAGILKSTDAARQTSEESALRSFRHRLPWLLVGLGGALLAADFVHWFEAALERTLLLAFFVPGIVYLADAVGTQTETMVVRGLSIGVRMRRMFRRELATGLALGLTLGATAGPIVWWRWGDPEVALCVSIAVFAACSTATLAAMSLPWLFAALGTDPAFGSGPLATVLQDLASILIYFGVALAVLG